MCEKTSAFEAFTFPSLLQKYDKILVPMIQRDYAQGRRDKKATDVRNNLLNDVFSEKEVHFDLIFGSKETRIIDGVENDCFIPVDGQQRLTTLFLLYLYEQKLLNRYQGLDLSRFSYDTRRAASDFCVSITSEDWHCEGKVSDSIKDSSWFLDYWAKDPTVKGMLNMLDAIDIKYKGCNSFPDLDRVSFYFFDLESNGLNENLYLKMNSRGKPLTAFENLKAKIEKILPETTKFNDKCFPQCEVSLVSFKERWKYFMDRDWTETFWDKDNPGLYDTYIARFIVRFLSGYWAAFGKDDSKQAEELQSINNRNDYLDFIPFEPIKKTLELDDAFPRLAYALTLLHDDSKIKPYWSKEQLKVGEKSEYKLIGVVLFYILFDGNPHAMHFAWNMSENTITGYDSFVTYCKRMGEIYNQYSTTEETDFYKALTCIDFDKPSEQLKEEIAKAKQILYGHPRSDERTWEEVIVKVEQFAFFKGAIRFLFSNELGNEKWSDFEQKWENAQLYFDKNGVRDNGDVAYRSKSILMKALVANCDNFWEKIWWHFEFSNEPTQWKRILTSKNWCGSVSVILNGNLNSISTNNKFILNIIDDGLLDFICNKMPNSRLRGTYHDYQAFWQSHHPNEQVVLNPILAHLKYNGQIEYSEKNRIKDSRYYRCEGKNVNFKFKDNYFQWWGEPDKKQLDVYLMDSDWKDYKKRPRPTEDKNTDEDKYYCFRVNRETKPDDFIEMLNSLIDDASNTSDIQ